MVRGTTWPEIPEPKSQVNPKRGKTQKLRPVGQLFGPSGVSLFTWDLGSGFWDFRRSRRLPGIWVLRLGISAARGGCLLGIWSLESGISRVSGLGISALADPFAQLAP